MEFRPISAILSETAGQQEKARGFGASRWLLSRLHGIVPSLSAVLFFHVDGLYSSVLPQAIPLTGKFEHGSQKIALEIYHDSRKSLPCREHFTAIHAHDQKAPGSKATAMVPCRNGRSRASSSDTQVGRKES